MQPIVVGVAGAVAVVIFSSVTADVVAGAVALGALAAPRGDVIGSISNGMELLALDSSIQFIVTGAVRSPP